MTDAPFTRLDRTVPGDRVHAFFRRAEDRAAAHERPEPEARGWTPRPTRADVERRPVRRVADVDQNAPQLIRLVRHPFVQDTARPARVQVMEAVEAPERGLPERDPRPWRLVAP